MNNLERIEELEKQLAALKAGLVKEAQEDSAEVSRWIWMWGIKEGDRYWCIGFYGEVFLVRWSGHDIDLGCLAIGNMYRTKEEAEQEVKRMKATARVKTRIAELNDGWKPDFGDFEQKKWFVYYDSVSGKIFQCLGVGVKSMSSDLYLKSEELAEQLIAEMEDDIKLMLGVE